MGKAEEIVELLNSLIEKDKKIKDLLECRVKVNEATVERADIKIRFDHGTPYVTVTGLICAICNCIDENIYSAWEVEGDNYKLVGFLSQLSGDQTVSSHDVIDLIPPA